MLGTAKLPPTLTSTSRQIKKVESVIPILTFCIQLIAVVERLVKAVCAITHMW